MRAGSKCKTTGDVASLPNDRNNNARPAVLRIVAPPPMLYLGALALGFVAHLILPHPILVSARLGQWLGVFFLAASSLLVRWSFVVLRRAGTSGNPRASSAALVMHGPFGLSRNPIYLAMTGLYLGVSLVLNSLWFVVLLIPLLLVMQHGVIAREEQYLAERFGDEYLNYKTAVRRWL